MSERDYLIAKAEREHKRDRKLGRKVAGAGAGTAALGATPTIVSGFRSAGQLRRAKAAGATPAQLDRLDAGLLHQHLTSRPYRVGSRLRRYGQMGVAAGAGIGALNMAENRWEKRKKRA